MNDIPTASRAKDPNSLERFASGSGDGVVKVWNLVDRKQLWATTGHENIVRSLAWTLDQKLLSCAADRTIKLWDCYNTASNSAPMATWLGTGAYTGISHHRSKNSFATSGNQVAIYDLERHSAPPEVYKWPTNTDTINCVEFNMIETSILGSTGQDRSIVLYDLRTQTPVSKTILNMVSNAFAWNPMEAMNFVVANEEYVPMILSKTTY